MADSGLQFGPRLVSHPTGALRAVMLARPSRAIEDARPLPGEPNAILSRALAELDVFASTLRYFNCAVSLIDGLSRDPWACALADLAVIFENGAVMMRPSAMRRRSEIAVFVNELERRDIPIAGHIAAPALIGGSDVLMMGDCAFIGRSDRNNALGRTGFTQIAQAHGLRAVEVQLFEKNASLRAVAGAVASDTIVFAQGGLDPAAFEGFKTIAVEHEQSLGAGVLNLGEHHVLADIRFPRCSDRLRAAGTTVEAIDLYDYSRVGITPSMLVIDLKRI